MDLIVLVLLLLDLYELLLGLRVMLVNKIRGCILGRRILEPTLASHCILNGVVLANLMLLLLLNLVACTTKCDQWGCLEVLMLMLVDMVAVMMLM